VLLPSDDAVLLSIRAPTNPRQTTHGPGLECESFLARISHGLTVPCRYDDYVVDTM